jgi:hypothetical protein
MASSYDPRGKKRYIEDWSAAVYPRHSGTSLPDTFNPSMSGDPHNRSGRSMTGNPLSFIPQHIRSGPSTQSARPTSSATQDTVVNNTERKRRHRISESLLEVTLEDGLQDNGQPGREDSIGHIRKFPNAECPATHLAKAIKFLNKVSSKIPDGTANHKSRDQKEVATYLSNMDAHPSVEVVERPPYVPEKSNMLQIIIRVKDEKAWESMDVWNSNSVFSR